MLGLASAQLVVQVYALLNKPMACTTTMAPGETEKTVSDIIPKGAVQMMGIHCPDVGPQSGMAWRVLLAAWTAKQRVRLAMAIQCRQIAVRSVCASGALVITDDGNLQVMMTQPDFKLWKTYLATVL